MRRRLRTSLNVPVLVLLLLGTSLGLPPLANGGITETFSDGRTSIELVFPDGGGEFTVYVKVPVNSQALNTSLTLRGKMLPNEKSFLHTSITDWGQGTMEKVSSGIENLQRDPEACSFSLMTSYPSGRGPHYVAIGDLNGDGLEDVAATNFFSNSTGIFYQKLDGTLDTMVSLLVGGAPNGLAIGDLNGDKRDDLAVAVLRDDLSGYIAIFNQTLSGTLLTRDDIPAGNYPDCLAMGDLDHNGKLDMAVSNWLDGTVGVYLQRPAGGFYNMIPYAVGTAPRGVAIGDVDSDGLDDLVAAVYNDNKTVIHYQESGQLKMPPTKLDSGLHPVGIALGDVNADTLRDVVVANSLSNTTGIYLQRPDRTLQGMITPAGTGAQPWQVATGDVNNDNRTDFAVSNYWPGADLVDVLAQTVQGDVHVLRNLATGAGPDGVAIGDLNNDSLNDIAVSNYRGDSLGVFTQQPYTGVYTSAQVPTPLNIVSVNATWTQTLRGAPVGVELSNDNGQNWTAATNGTELAFSTAGSELRYRLTFGSATSLDEIRANITLETVYPTDLSLDVGSDGTIDWSFPGELASETSLPDFSHEVTAFVANHTEDAHEGNISVPLRLTSSTAGILNLSGISVAFNIPPVIRDFSPRGTPIIIDENESKSFSVSAVDPEDQPLAYTWKLDGVFLPGTGPAITYTPDFDSSGMHNLTAEISDGISTVANNWEVRIRNIDRPPELVELQPAGDPGAREGQNVTFRATARDPDFDRLTVDWHLDGALVKSEAGGAASFTYRPWYGDAARPHNVTVSVFDGELRASHGWLFNVTSVNPLVELNFTSPAGDSFALDEGGSQQFSIDGDAVKTLLGNFTLRWLLDSNFITNASTYTYEPGFASSGNHTLTVSVTAGGLRFLRNWKISVREVTNPPRFTSAFPRGENVQIREGEKQEFSVAVEDPDNDPLNYTWYLTYDGIFNQTVSTAASYSFDANWTSAGDYFIRVTVSDGRAWIDRTWKLTVVHAAPPAPAEAATSNMLVGVVAGVIVLAVLGGVLFVAWRKRESLSSALDHVGEGKGAVMAAPAPAAPAPAAPAEGEAPKPKPKVTYPCPSCGQPVEEDWFVCHHCSAALKEAGAMPTTRTSRVTVFETRATDEALARAKVTIEAVECPRCGKILEPWMQNCPTCGEFVRKAEPEGGAVAPAGNCPSCSAPVEAGWFKCPECGAQLKEPAAAPAGEGKPVAPAAPDKSLAPAEAPPPAPGEEAPAPPAAPAVPKPAEPAPPPSGGEAATPAAAKCPTCGAETEAGWLKCPECGMELK